MPQPAGTSLSFTKLFVTDFAKSIDFFTNVLGLVELERFVGEEAGRVCDEILYSSHDGIAVVAVAYRDGNVPKAMPDIGVGVEVADVDSVLRRAEAAGCKIGSIGRAANGVATAQIFTPDGHLVIVSADGSPGAGNARFSQLVVDDLDGNVDFFKNVLKVGVRERNDGVIVSGEPATEVVLEIEPRLSLLSYQSAAAPKPTGATYVGFIVDDLDGAIARAQNSGSRVVRGVKPSGGGPVNVKSAIITGVEGHRLELAEVV